MCGLLCLQGKYKQLFHQLEQVPNLIIKPNSRLSSNTTTKWLWEAGADVQDYHRAHLRGTRTGAFQITLNSKQSIETDLITRAFTHLQWKVPSHGLCLDTRDDKLWFCQPPDPKMDFEVLNVNATKSEVTRKVMGEGFSDPRVSPWRARFLPCGPNASCSIPEVQEKFPYQYDLFFCTHHGIMDGLAVLFAISCLHRILNEVIEGKTISDEVFAPFTRNLDLPAQIKAFRDKFVQDKKQFEAVKTPMPAPDRSPLLYKVFPRPTVTSPSTRHIACIIAPDIMQRFQKKLKQDGVTFNSALVAVINTSIMELAMDNGLLQKDYSIASCILINGKRYMKPSTSRSFGSSALAMSYINSVEHTAKDKFWEYSKKVNDELQHCLKLGLPLQQAAAQQLTNSNSPVIDYITTFRPVLHDYSLTNIGDLSLVLPSDGDHVQITNATSFNLVHNYAHNSFHEVLSFRGRCYYNFTYATNYISDDTASVILNKVIPVLEDVSR